MSRSICGELTEQAEIHFSHPNSFLSPKLASLTALGYAIANGQHEEITAILKETKEFLLNEFDYSGNTPLVSDICFVFCYIAVFYCLAHAAQHEKNIWSRETLHVPL